MRNRRSVAVRCLSLLFGAAVLVACERKPASPGEVVNTSSEAVLQCSVDTDCMINRVCDGGQCKVRSANVVTNPPAPATESTSLNSVLGSDHNVGVDPDMPLSHAADPAYPTGTQAVIGEVQVDDTERLPAEALALEQERTQLERERVAEEKRRLERERRELERQRKKIAEQRAAEQEAREREEQEFARQQAAKPDAQYEQRRQECPKGFIGSACRKRLRNEICSGHWSPNPPEGNATCKSK